MFTDEQWEEGQIIADGLLDGDPEAFRRMALELARMVAERDLTSIPNVMAAIACLLPPEVQSRVQFGAN